MRYLTILAAAAATLLAGAAVAKDKPADGQPKEKKVCRVEVLSNSRIPERRICRTEAEWAAQSDDDSHKASDAVRAASRNGN